MKNLKTKINYILITKPCSIVIVLLTYLLVLRGSTLAYCSWMDNHVFWDFPLEKDVANQSWEEAPTPIPSYDVIGKRWEHMEQYQRNLEESRKQHLEDQRIANIMKQAQKSPLIPKLPVHTDEALNFMMSLESLSNPDNKAWEIQKRLYIEITRIIDSTPAEDINIKALIHQVITKDITYDLWIAKSETDIKSPDSLVNRMIHINDFKITHDNTLNRAEKSIIAHMNTHYQILNAANVLGHDGSVSFKDTKAYDSFYKQNLNK